MANASQSESVIDRFTAYGYHCIRVEGGHDMEKLAMLSLRHGPTRASLPSSNSRRSLQREYRRLRERPVVTERAEPSSPNPPAWDWGCLRNPLHVSDEVRGFFQQRTAEQVENRKRWNETFQACGWPIRKKPPCLIRD